MGPWVGKVALPGPMAERRQYRLSFASVAAGRWSRGARSFDFSREIRNQMYVKSDFQILATVQSLKCLWAHLTVLVGST